MSTFSIENDRVRGAQYIETQNQGGLLWSRRFIVMHYTAGPSVDRAIENFTDPTFRASAHFVVSRTGAVTQLVSLENIAWHAGRSFWRPEKGHGHIVGLRGMNRHSIGIEMVNAGKLKKVGGAIESWWGKPIPPKEVFFDDDNRPWHAYPSEQLHSVELLLRALWPLGFEELLGHSDVSPRRKVDPGPAFPMEHMRALLYGRSEC